MCSKLGDNYKETDGYHTKCYKIFTAVRKQEEKGKETSSQGPTFSGILSSEVSSLVAAGSGVLQAVYIFCAKERKKNKGIYESLSITETVESERTIKHAVAVKEYHEFLAKLGDLDFVAKEVKHHRSCRINYVADAERIQNKHQHADSTEKSEYSETHKIHNEACQTLSIYIDTFIIKEQYSELVTSVNVQYQRILKEYGISDSTYTTQYLVEKIIGTFGEDLMISKESKKDGNVLYHTTLSSKEAIQNARAFSMSSSFVVTQTALQLRMMILDLSRSSQELPAILSAEVLKRGQAALPDELLQFFRVLCTGSEKAGDPDSCSERYAMSTSSDAVFQHQMVLSNLVNNYPWE